jgi:subtilase family serine protease
MNKLRPALHLSGWAALLACGVGGVAQAQSAAHPTLATKIPAIVAAGTAAYVASPAPDTVMHLAIALPMRDMAGLDALQRDIYDPASPNYHQYLSVAQFTERFGPTQADYEAAASFFAAQGLTIAARTANRYLIDVDGRVADIERVFHVKMGFYRHPTEARLFVAPDRAPTLDLAVPILQVIGLDDFVLPHPKLVHSARPSASRGGTGPGGQFTGTDMRHAYYPVGTLNGAGQSIGLFEFVGYNIADVKSFFANKYGPVNKVPVVGIKTDSQPLSCTGSCDDGEQALDIEYAISMAPGLASVRVYVGSIAEDILNKMATDNISKVLSSSWGWNENFAADDAIFKEYAVQGQTNLTASGDNSSLAASGPWPEEDANIIAVGGTDVATGTTGLWSSETGWSGSAGGPTLDKTIKIEPYQLKVVHNTSGASLTLRNVPDIALNANTDMEICADGSCVGGYGGTSFASPMWAGIVAMANQQALAKGKPVVGFINPAVYALAAGVSYKTLFHDPVSGKSGKYSCVPGYDLVTGVGSPQGQLFINALVAK